MIVRCNQNYDSNDLHKLYFINKSVIFMRIMDHHHLKANKSPSQSIRSGRDVENNTYEECNSQQEFSFNRQICKNSQHICREKYAQIYNDLKVMSAEDIIELLLDQLQENQKYKHQVFNQSNKIKGLQQQIASSREALKKKREAISLFSETESKNLQLIQKLENKMTKKNDYGRDTHYEKKYQQLSFCMNQYIRNINAAQDQFKRAYSILKIENARQNKQMEELNGQYIQMYKKTQVLTQKLKKAEKQLNQLSEFKKRATTTLCILTQENQILKKQIQIYQQNIRITDRLQVHLQHEHHQLSSELDFIREKICENQSISKDIIEKLEESSSNCEKVSRAKEQMNDSLKKYQQKNSSLQKEISNLKINNQKLNQDLQKLKQQNDFVNRQRDELQEDMAQTQLQKQSIRRQLLILAQKVKLMQSTYRKQIQQSEKIKGQLFKFWENKQKKQTLVKDMSLKVLGEIKVNGCDYSQSTFSHSEKESKLSLWQKKSQHEASSNLNEKENLQYEMEDSLYA